MKLKSILTAVTLTRKYKKADIAARLNITPPSYIDSLNRSSNMYVATLLRILSVMDCDLVIHDRKTDQSFIVTPDSPTPQSHVITKK